jgi:hypothetical protein
MTPAEFREARNRPSNGNLIIDIALANSSGTTLPAMDGEITSSGPVCSRAYALSASATTASGKDNKSFITQFTFDNFSVPTGSNLGWLIFTSKLNGIDAIDDSVCQHFFNGTPSI